MLEEKFMFLTVSHKNSTSMAVRMTDGGSGYAGIQETQPPGQGAIGNHLFTSTITLGSTGPCIAVIICTPGGELKVLLVEHMFILDPVNNDRPGVVPDADSNLCAHCGASTNV